MDYVFTIRWYHVATGKTGLHRLVSGKDFPYLVSAWCRDGWFYHIVDRSYNNQFLAKDEEPLAEYAPCLGGEPVQYKWLKS